MILNVKHAGTVHSIDLPPHATGLILKEKLYELTEVPPPKQKILIKGKQLKNDDVVDTLVKPNQQVFMLGTADKNLVQTTPTPTKNEPETETPIQEDLQLEPVGIRNTGNTCYASSTLQALHTVNELNTTLSKYDGNDLLLRSWSQLLKQFDNTTNQPVLPTNFLSQLRVKFNQFAERGEGGIYKQQDAEELYTQLMSVLKQDTKTSPVVNYFDGQFQVLRNGEVHAEEEFSKLMCHINVKTNFLKDGIKQSLKDLVEVSGEEITVEKQIVKMPKYLIVQFVRFFWRKDTKMNSKILRKVTFPVNLDISDLCSEELQARLAPAREAYRELEGAVEEQERAKRRAKFQKLDNETSFEDSARKQAAEAEAELEQKQQQRLLELKDKFRNSLDSDLKQDETCSPHGLYDLQAVITHQGMSADSGHYQCFIKNDKDKKKWWKLNDDKVTEFDAQRLAELAGGGASDSALILVYKSSDI